MHALQVFITKADSAEVARQRVEAFLAPYGGEAGNAVWDWYEIGGRWSGLGKVKKASPALRTLITEMIEGHALRTADQKQRVLNMLAAEGPADMLLSYNVRVLGDMLSEYTYSANNSVYHLTDDIETNVIPDDFETGGYFVVFIDIHY